MYIKYTENTQKIYILNKKRADVKTPPLNCPISLRKTFAKDKHKQNVLMVFIAKKTNKLN